MLIEVEERLVTTGIDRQQEFKVVKPEPLEPVAETLLRQQISLVPLNIMERPKSAKFNSERFQKSANTKRVIVKAVENSENEEKVSKSVLIKEELADDEPMKRRDDEAARRRKEQRLMASKSAFAGTARLRPQSARHNLEKYRQDVLIEKQRKLEMLQKLQQLNSNNNPTENQENQKNVADINTNVNLFK